MCTPHTHDDALVPCRPSEPLKDEPQPEFVFLPINTHLPPYFLPDKQPYSLSLNVSPSLFRRSPRHPSRSSPDDGSPSRRPSRESDISPLRPH